MENLEAFYKLMIEYPWCTFFTFCMIIVILSTTISLIATIGAAFRGNLGLREKE